MICAIIPARFGSKRIKKKNIKNFHKKPMISWTLKKIVKSNIFDKIVVTSDSKKILNLSKKNGADMLIHRPKNLSGDNVATLPAIRHAIKQVQKKNIARKEIFVCCIYPCNPFLNLKDLKKGLDICKKNTSNFVFPLVEYSHPIQRALSLDKNLNTKLFFKNNSKKRTQDLRKAYFDAGQFYWGISDFWYQKNNIHKYGKCLVIPSWRVVDIDNLNDWKRAEILFKNHYKYFNY